MIERALLTAFHWLFFSAAITQMSSLPITLALETLLLLLKSVIQPHLPGNSIEGGHIAMSGDKKCNAPHLAGQIKPRHSWPPGNQSRPLQLSPNLKKIVKAIAI